MDWNSFLYKSDSNRPTPEKTYYHHWLPKNLKKLLPFPLPDGEKIPDYYQEFNTLIHVTTFENAVQILKDGFKPLCVSDNSVVNGNRQLFDGKYNKEKPVKSRTDHPIQDKGVIWYGPTTFQISSFDRYGNVGFLMKKLGGYEGILKEDGDLPLKFYIIEIIEYFFQSAIRILVTTNTYPELREYNPYKKGGPFYYDKENEKLYFLKKARYHTSESEEDVVKCVVEFMKDPTGPKSYHVRKHFKNHFIKFGKCYQPRWGVEFIDLKRKIYMYNML